MIEEIGVVTKIEGNMARVIVQKRGACDGCKAQGTCETTEEGAEIEAVNMAQAKEGQAVKISIKAQTYLKGTMLVYGLSSSGMPFMLIVTLSVPDTAGT